MCVFLCFPGSICGVTAHNERLSSNHFPFDKVAHFLMLRCNVMAANEKKIICCCHVPVTVRLLYGASASLHVTSACLSCWWELKSCVFLSWRYRCEAYSTWIRQERREGVQRRKDEKQSAVFVFHHNTSAPLADSTGRWSSSFVGVCVCVCFFVFLKSSFSKRFATH